jgi:hypothetical protein
VADEGGPSTVVAAIREHRDRALPSRTIIALVDGKGMTSMTGNVTVPKRFRPLTCGFRAPGRTRTCTLRIRSETRTVRLVSSWSIVPGCVRSAVRLGNWLSLAICAVIPLVGLLPRIAVEETELARVLGDQYRSYQKATRRLVPGLW